MGLPCPYHSENVPKCGKSMQEKKCPLKIVARIVKWNELAVDKRKLPKVVKVKFRARRDLHRPGKPVWSSSGIE